VDKVVTSSSKAREILRIEGSDPRSDNRRRVIDVAREAVTIRRAVSGISMAIRIVSSAYSGVALRITGYEDGRFHYEVRLVHRDPDLSVSLGEGEDRAAVEAQWREWVRFLRLPALVGRTGTGDVEVNIDATDLACRLPGPHGRGHALASRRPRFLARRKIGCPALAQPVDLDPHALFFGSKLDR
jgi:Family of unknown function (DUF6101)